jgi:hypothetical protein
VNLFPDHFPRALTIAAVAVVALGAAIMVSRGLSGGPASPSPAAQTQKPQPQPHAQPQPKAKPKPAPSAGADRAAAPSKPKRSAKAYVTCIQAAEDLQALDRCQALLP